MESLCCLRGHLTTSPLRTCSAFNACRAPRYATGTLSKRLNSSAAGSSSKPVIHKERLLAYINQNAASLNIRVNEITGYDRVEALKESVGAQERMLELQRRTARDAKDEYQAAVAARTRAQQAVNSLLERKHSWTDHDVAEFTSLVRSDHSANAAVNAASLSLSEAESRSDKAFSDLMRTILERYHEEHTWSDKIRYISTWANVLGLLVNLVVFVGAIALVEPWKRRRLVKNLEERLESLVADLKSEIAPLHDDLASLHSAVAPPAAAYVEPPLSTAVDPDAHQLLPPSWMPRWFVAHVWARRPSVIADMTYADIVALAFCTGAAGIALYIHAS